MERRHDSRPHPTRVNTQYNTRRCPICFEHFATDQLEAACSHQQNRVYNHSRQISATSSNGSGSSISPRTSVFVEHLPANTGNEYAIEDDIMLEIQGLTAQQRRRRSAVSAGSTSPRQVRPAQRHLEAPPMWHLNGQKLDFH